MKAPEIQSEAGLHTSLVVTSLTTAVCVDEWRVNSLCTLAAEGSQASERIPVPCCNAVLSEIKQSPKASITVLRMGASESSQVLRNSKVVLCGSWR